MFQDRVDAGKKLGEKLRINSRNAIVAGIPRGGVVVAAQVAESLKAPLTCIPVKKIRSPDNPELALGAVTLDGIKYIDWNLALRSGVTQDYLDGELKEREKEVIASAKKFGFNQGIFQKGFTVIVVDDGVATGATIRAVLSYFRKKNVNCILAVPVIAEEVYRTLQSEVQMIAVLEIPQTLSAVGEYYRDFLQVSDEEVVKLLASSV
jgi:putative phosphoribosyl transferase